MSADRSDPFGGPITALTQAVIGAVAVGIIALLPSDQSLFVPRATALFGMWLCLAGLVIYIEMRRRSASHARASVSIPLRSWPPTGRFTLQPRADGSRVEIVAGRQVVAEVEATDLGDQIVIDTAAVAAADLVDLRAAVGQAVEMAAKAEDEYVAGLKMRASPGVRVLHGRCRSPVRFLAWTRSGKNPLAVA